jgi:hypothetical protein
VCPRLIVASGMRPLSNCCAGQALTRTRTPILPSQLSSFATRGHPFSSWSLFFLICTGPDSSFLPKVL